MLILSNYGLRYLMHQRRLHPKLDTPILSALASLTREPFDGGREQLQLIKEGYALRVDPAMNPDALRLRYQRNPLEHVERIVFELTRACDLHCAHCRNGADRASEVADLGSLKAVIDAAYPLGLQRFDFIGGEVTRFGDGLFDLLRHAQSKGPMKAAIITNGTFLGPAPIKTRGGRFDNSRAFLDALKAAGLTHMIYSLDGPREIHDRSRGVEGLHDRIWAGFAETRAAGIEPRVSLVFKPDRLTPEFAGWMERLAEALHGRPDIEAMLRDPFTYASNFIDVGNGAGQGQGRWRFEGLDAEMLRCKNFYRPYPSLRIKANGALSLCPLASAGDISHKVQGGFIEAVNALQEALPYRIHAEGRLHEYLPFLDQGLFPDAFEHPCAPRTILMLLAKRVEAEGIDSPDDPRLKRVNEAVALEAGYGEPSPQTLGLGDAPRGQ